MDEKADSSIRIEDVKDAGGPGDIPPGAPSLKDPPPAYSGAAGRNDPMGGLTAEQAQQMAEWDGLQWSEFMQNTTIHGVKYIFEKSAVKLRRCLWVLMVVTSFTFFAVMVGIRTRQYLKHETNIALELKFEDQVPFPAVTLCNQNSFRMTKVIEMGLYHVIDDIYSAENITSVRLSDYDAATQEKLNMSADDFLLGAAHTLHDLIDKCTWMGEKCDVAKDFAVTFTEFGVCYTFNGDPEAVKFVDDTSRGLSLILNVEQYEHMRGPQNDAGVKMLLHSQGETPLMKDQGFAVSPGSHILAAVSMTRTLSMEPPWGTCSETAPATSDCKNTFRSNHFLSECKCKQQFMNSTTPVDNVANCTLADRFSCIIPQDSHVKLSSDACTVPCNVTVYEPSLSYAQLSIINIERLVLTETGRRDTVTAQYHRALEALQRVNPTISSDDQKTITTLREESEALKQMLLGQLAVFDANSSMAVFIDDLNQWMSDDFMNVQFLSDGIANLVSNAMPKHVPDTCLPSCYVLGIETYLGTAQLQELIRCSRDEQPAGLSFPLVDISQNAYDYATVLQTCPEADTSSDEGTDGGDGGGDTGEAVELDGCAKTITDTMAIINSLYVLGNYSLNYLQGFEASYDQTMDRIYNDTDMHYGPEARHQACKAQLGSLDLWALTMSTSLMLQMLQAPDYDTLTAAAEEFNGVFNYNEDPFGSLVSQMGELSVCWWVVDKLDEPPGYEPPREQFTLAKSEVTAMELTRDSISKLIVSFLSHLATNIDPLIEVGQQYLDGTVTKAMLAGNFTQRTITSASERILAINTDTQSDKDYFTTKFTGTGIFIVTAFDSLFDTGPPLLNTSNLQSFSTIRYANRTSNATLNALYHSLIHYADKRKPVTDIITMILQSELEEKLNYLSSQMANYTATLSDLIDDRQLTYQRYLDSTHISQRVLTENFLQVDVFYKDVSFETISQREAFAVSSLFGEVGGFLGLLLGASILTVCELLDYIAMVCLKRCKTKKQTAPGAWP